MGPPGPAELTAQLEALVAQQRERIRQLEALLEASGGGGASEEDCRQLTAIVEAQEVALNEQRQVLESQSSVIDELNRQLQSQLLARQRESDLEALVEEQRKRIDHLEAAERQSAAADSGASQGEEVLELRALIEAQENAMGEQRQIIANQSSLIDELNGYVQSHICSEQREVPTPRLGNLSDIPECTKVQAHVAPGPGLAGPGGATPIATSTRTTQRRKTNDAGSPRSAAAARSQGACLSRRSLREQHLAQQKDLPRPRPNSVLGGRPPGGSAGNSTNGSTPRARSTTMERLNSRCSSPQPVRASSPRGPVRQHSGIPRRAGGPVPSLPVLRQEA